ncbi:MAG: hypothetical protein O3C18_04190, partial [Bacteroidetes bacterium]|nr:hypothetical protein [Bacteroidota bacterium]
RPPIDPLVQDPIRREDDGQEEEEFEGVEEHRAAGCRLCFFLRSPKINKKQPAPPCEMSGFIFEPWTT